MNRIVVSPVASPPEGGLYRHVERQPAGSTPQANYFEIIFGTAARRNDSPAT
jgi:hypothetical protein